MSQESTRFGKYELFDLLGEGGMARVFHAHQTGPMGFRKEVALKQIRPHVSREEKMVKALINEARLGGNLHHKNIVEVYEFGDVEGTLFIAMEYIRGHTLHDVLRQVPVRGALPPRIVAEIAIQLCEGLAYAHAACDVDGAPMNLVHRDLKPANVIIDLSGVVKIMDFGIARSDTNLFHTTTGMTKGTPIYMSPEQVKKSKDRPLTGRSDLFSLATVITELVTGEVVFRGTELYEVLHKIAGAETAEQVAMVGERIPALVPVLERAFEQNPADRFADADEMMAAIEGLFPQLPGQETVVSWLPGWMDEAGQDPVAHPEGVSRTNLADSNGGQAPAPIGSSEVAVIGDGCEKGARSTRSVSGQEAAEKTPEVVRQKRGSRLPLVLVGAGIVAVGGLLVVAAMAGVFGAGSADEPAAVSAELMPQDVEGEACGGGTVTAAQPDGGELDAGNEDAVSARAGSEHRDAEGRGAEASVAVDTQTIEGLPTDEAPVHSAPAPVVSITSQPRVLGGLTVDDVTGPLAMALDSFNACLAAGLARNPDLQGEMTQIFVIDPDGGVVETNVDASTVGDAAVESCFAGVIGSMAFPAPSDGEIVVVEYRFGLGGERPD